MSAKIQNFTISSKSIPICFLHTEKNAHFIVSQGTVKKNSYMKLINLFLRIPRFFWKISVTPFQGTFWAPSTRFGCLPYIKKFHLYTLYKP